MADKTDKILSFEDILTAKDLETKDLHVPEWNGTVRFQAMSGENRDEYVQILQSRMVGAGAGRKLGNFKGLPALLLQMCLVKGDGSPLFTRQQLDQLQGKNGEVINRLTEIAQKMNGLTDEEVTEQAKNSETGRKHDDGTYSPNDLGAPSGKPSGA